MDVDLAPAHEPPRDLGVGLGVRGLEGGERLVAEDDPEAERVVGRVALVDDHLVRGVEALEEDREIQPARAAARDRDPHPRDHMPHDARRRRTARWSWACSVAASLSMAIDTHLQRVSGYCALVAERLGMDADLMRVASRLHDVGMAAVSGAVLSRPGPLTTEERREMQDHAQLGHAMLAGSGVEALETAAEIARTHHERWDGGGYPRGLAGEDIP